MKKYLPFLIALFFSSLVMGQNNLPEQHALTWSKAISNKKKATYSEFIGENEEGVFVTKTTLKRELRGNQAFPVLEVYDKNFNLVKSQDLEVKEGKGKIIYENTVLMEGNLYLFYSIVYVWNRTVMLMVQPLDITTLNPVGEPKKAVETEFSIFIKRDDLPDFEFDFSDDNSSLLVSFIEQVGGNKNQKVHLYAFNGHLEQAWGKVIELPYQAKMFEMVSRSIDNQGNVYLLGSKYLEGNREKKNGKPNYDYVLMGYSPGGTPSFSHNIVSKDKFFRDMRVAVTPKSEIICTGYYSKDGTYSIAGAYYLKLDKKTGSALNESYNDFTLDFLTQNLDTKDVKKTAKRTKKGKSNQDFTFRLNDLVVREDGGTTLVGEQRKYTTITTTTPAQPNSSTFKTYFETTSSSNYYSYEDIIVVHLSSEGNLNWAEKIAKKQNTAGDFGLFSSYVMAVEDDRLHFIFNENRQNRHFNGKGALANFNPRKSKKNAALALVTLDAQGNKSKRHLAQPSGSTVFIKSSTSRQFSQESLFLFGQYKKDFRLARMEF